MPSRNYCDRCDKLIPENDLYYGVDTTVKSHGPFDEPVRSDVNLGNAKWVNAIQSLRMLCKKCIIEVLKVLLTKPDVGA